MCLTKNHTWNLGRHEELVAIVFDLGKAFDSVSHNVLQYAMLKRGIPVTVASMDCSNMIIGDIPVKTSGRGVKEGEPLSSSLYNLALDTALF